MPKTLDITVIDQIETAKAAMNPTNHHDWRPGRSPGLSHVYDAFEPLARQFAENLRYFQEVPWSTADEMQRHNEQLQLAEALQDFALWVLVTGYEQEEGD